MNELLNSSDADLLRLAQTIYDIPSLAAWRAAELKALRQCTFTPPVLEIGCGNGRFASLLMPRVQLGRRPQPARVGIVRTGQPRLPPPRMHGCTPSQICRWSLRYGLRQLRNRAYSRPAESARGMPPRPASRRRIDRHCSAGRDESPPAAAQFLVYDPACRTVAAPPPADRRSLGGIAFYCRLLDRPHNALSIRPHVPDLGSRRRPALYGRRPADPGPGVPCRDAGHARSPSLQTESPMATLLHKGVPEGPPGNALCDADPGWVASEPHVSSPQPAI